MPAPKDKITEAIRKMQKIQERVREEAKKVREQGSTPPSPQGS